MQARLLLPARKVNKPVLQPANNLISRYRQGGSERHRFWRFTDNLQNPLNLLILMAKSVSVQVIMAIVIFSNNLFIHINQ